MTFTRQGERLKEIRARLGVSTREVAVLSKIIADAEGEKEFHISNSWLTQVENQNALPSIYKLFTLSCIYGVGLSDLLMIFGVDTRKATDYHLQIAPRRTHPFQVGSGRTDQPLEMPVRFDSNLDLNRTTLVPEEDVQLELFRRSKISGAYYGYIGFEDYTLYPMIRPGSVVQIDNRHTELATTLWQTEFDRPIYFLEFRNGYACGWCEREGEKLIVVPHPNSPVKTRTFSYPSEVEIVGRVIWVAMRIVQNGTGTQVSSGRQPSPLPESRAGLISNRTELPRKWRSRAVGKRKQVDPVARFHELINREISGKASMSELDDLREIEASLDQKDRKEMDSLEVTVQKRHEDLMRQLADLSAKLAALKSK
jgi:transcriptional regulator with XRE-family HTH domain